jgi:hypothetical protein
MSEEWPIVSSYSWQQAVEDGDLVKVFENRWPELSQGKPILATSHLFGEVSLAALQEIWNEYVTWTRTIEPTLKEEDRLFITVMDLKKVWLIDDGTTFTLLFPEDY